MTIDATKQRYRVPVVTADAEVSLDEFSNSEIAEYLRRQGYWVSETSTKVDVQDGDVARVINPDALNRIEHLAMCGQKEAAQQETLSIVGAAIGRML